MDRAGDLKGELVEFALSPRFDRVLTAFVDEQYPRGGVDEDKMRAIVEEFLFGYRLPDGASVVDKFVASRRDLSAGDREMMLGWKDFVQGVFEIRERDGDALVVFNMVDELTYRVRSNMDAEGIERIPVGGVMIGNIVPVDGEWMMSGSHQSYEADALDEMRDVAAQMAMQSPDKAFRNKEKLAKAREMQAEQYASFVDHFGSDTIVVPGRDVGRKVRDFFRHDYERAGHDPADWTDPGFDFAELRDVDSVGIIFDVEDGLGFVPDYAEAQKAFATPELVIHTYYRELISYMLRDGDASPVPLRRLAEADPAKASRVFQKLLKKPSFSWERDGEALLRRYKRDYYENPPLPHTVPVGLEAEF